MSIESFLERLDNALIAKRQPDECDSWTIRTTRQFLEWHQVIETELREQQDFKYRSFERQLADALTTCENISIEIQEIESCLEKLALNYQLISDKTRGVQDTCEKVIKEEQELLSNLSQLKFTLSFFNDLDPIMRFLSSTPIVCLEDAFLPFLVRIDEAILFFQSKVGIYAYCNTKSEYKESAVYLLKYQQCMLKAMISIKEFVLNSLRMLHTDLRSKIEQMPNLKQTLYYDKFRKLGIQCKPLIEEMNTRTSSVSGYTLEFVADCCSVDFMIRELVQSFAAIRKHLLMSEILKEAQDILTSSKDFIVAFQSSVYYVQAWIQKEADIFQCFFSPEYYNEFETFVDQMSESFYQTLCPLILQEARIESLSQVLEFVVEICGPFLLNTAASNAMGSQQLDPLHLDLWSRAFNRTMDVFIQDIQERLVFRSQQWIHSEIANFKTRDQELLVFILPSPIPSQDKQEPLASLNQTSLHKRRPSFLSQSNSSRKLNSFYGGGEWYPPVPKTLWILSVLYTSAPSSVFQQMAQEVLEFCRLTLKSAHESIKRLASSSFSSASPSSSVLDSKKTKKDKNVTSLPSVILADIFMFKHLVYLREEIQLHFSLFEFVKTETLLDFENVLVKAFELVHSPSGLDMTSLGDIGKELIGAAAAPNLNEHAIDGKQMIDQELKLCCEDLIFEGSQWTLEPLMSFYIKVKALKVTKESIGQHKFASQEQILEIYKVFTELISSRLEPLLNSIVHNCYTLCYVQDQSDSRVAPAVDTLFRYFKEHILENYRVFYEWCVSVHPGITIASLDELSETIQEIWNVLIK